MPVSSLELDVSILEYTRMFYNCTSSNCSHFLQQEIRWDLVVIHGQISQSTVSKLRPSRKDLVIWNIQFLDLFGGYLFSWANWIPVLIVCT